MEVPLLLAVLGLFVAVRTLFLVRRRRTALRRPAVPLLPRPEVRAPDRARVVDLRASDRPVRARAGRRRATPPSRVDRPGALHRPGAHHPGVYHRAPAARPSRTAA